MEKKDASVHFIQISDVSIRFRVRFQFASVLFHSFEFLRLYVTFFLDIYIYIFIYIYLYAALFLTGLSDAGMDVRIVDPILWV